MSYETAWLVEKWVLHITVKDEITLDTISAISNRIIQYIEQSDMPYVHLLISDKSVRRVPKQLLQVLKAAQALRHPRLGWLIIYGADNNKLFKFVTDMLARIVKFRYRRFLTQQEALAFLQTVDSTLPKLDAPQS